MIKIKGKIVKGYGEAGKNLKSQFDYFEKYVPEITSYYQGTINVLLERPLIIFKTDIETEPIKWHHDQNNPEEKFGFINIKFKIIDSNESSVDALIYVAYRSPHYANPFYIEVLAPHIRHNESDFCHIIIDKEVKEISGIVLD